MASFAVEEGWTASKLAEVFVSMANTRGGTIVMGVRDSDRAVVGVGLRGATSRQCCHLSREDMTPSGRILVIAGPNGAGKTTFAVEFLPNEADCPLFVNTDLIAAGLSPFRPNLAAVQAGRLTLQRIGEHVRRGDSFAFETTLSGRGYARRIPRWQTLGYRVELFFLRLPTPAMAAARVAHRVSCGGHDVPKAAILQGMA